MSCLFFGCTSEVGHLFENGVGHIHENKVGIFLENLGLMVGHFPEKSHLQWYGIVCTLSLPMGFTKLLSGLHHVFPRLWVRNECTLNYAYDAEADTPPMS